MADVSSINIERDSRRLVSASLDGWICWWVVSIGKENELVVELSQNFQCDAAIRMVCAPITAPRELYIVTDGKSGEHYLGISSILQISK